MRYSGGSLDFGIGLISIRSSAYVPLGASVFSSMKCAITVRTKGTKGCSKYQVLDCLWKDQVCHSKMKITIIKTD